MLKVKKKILFDGIHLSTAKSKGPARYHYATHITVFLIYVAINMIDLIQCKRVHVEQNFNRVSLV